MFLNEFFPCQISCGGIFSGVFYEVHKCTKTLVFGVEGATHCPPLLLTFSWMDSVTAPKEGKCISPNWHLQNSDALKDPEPHRLGLLSASWLLLLYSFMDNLI